MKGPTQEVRTPLLVRHATYAAQALENFLRVEGIKERTERHSIPVEAKRQAKIGTQNGETRTAELKLENYTPDLKVKRHQKQSVVTKAERHAQ